MTETEHFILFVGVLMAVFGLAYAVRNWPHDPTNDEFWP